MDEGGVGGEVKEVIVNCSLSQQVCHCVLLPLVSQAAYFYPGTRHFQVCNIWQILYRTCKILAKFNHTVDSTVKKLSARTLPTHVWHVQVKRTGNQRRQCWFFSWWMSASSVVPDYQRPLTHVVILNYRMCHYREHCTARAINKVANHQLELDFTMS